MKRSYFALCIFFVQDNKVYGTKGGEGLLGRVRIEVDQGTYIVRNRTFATVNILLLFLKSNINLS